MIPPQGIHAFRKSDGPTPEFVRWCLDRDCPLREGIDPRSPAAVAHHLKPLAAIDHCRRGGWRLIRPGQLDVCLDPRSLADDESLRGCFWNEVAEFYGGAPFCRGTCGGCPANVRGLAFEDYPPLPQPTAPDWAGCFGWLRRDAILVAAVERWFARNADDAWYARWDLLRTTPAWNGLWSISFWRGDHLREFARLWQEVLESVVLPDPTAGAELRDFCNAVQASCRAGVGLSVELVPSGATRGTTWTVDSHCPRCKHAMPAEAHRCGCCGQTSRAHPPIHRKRLGYRPFLQLRGLVDPPQFDIIRSWAQSMVRGAHLAMPQGK